MEDKFALLGLEPLPATRVQAPLVAGCHASVECRVVSEFFTEGLHLFVGEALAAHVDQQLPPVGRLAGKTYRLGKPI
ncbi:MAG: flavin reductase family protein [Candidatus Binatia bacterium]